MSWREQAACAGHDTPDIFFEEDVVAQQQAMRLCAVCPVREQCLEFALRHKQDDGIWGGMTGQRRHALRKRMGRKAG